jgi:predicted molibdopterin-dependent oxidoreductase YjgC
VVVVAGRSNLAESGAATVAAVERLLDAVPGATVLPAFRRGNVVGALQHGLAPAEGRDAVAALQAAAAGAVELLVLVGADPLSDCPDADLARRALAGARRIVAVDAFATDSVQRADVVLAAAVAGEKRGSTTNLEGRVSPVAEKVTAAGTARPDWMIAVELGSRLDLFADGHPLARALTVDDVAAAAERVDPPPAGAVTFAAPPRNRYDYRLVVSRTLYDRAVGTTMSPSLAGLMGSPGVRVHPLDLDAIGVAAGSDVKLVGARATVVLPIGPDARVPRGSVWAPFNHSAPAGARVEDLIDATAPVTDVRIELV